MKIDKSWFRLINYLRLSSYSLDTMIGPDKRISLHIKSPDPLRPLGLIRVWLLRLIQCVFDQWSRKTHPSISRRKKIMYSKLFSPPHPAAPNQL